MRSLPTGPAPFVVLGAATCLVGLALGRLAVPAPTTPGLQDDAVRALLLTDIPEPRAGRVLRWLVQHGDDASRAWAAMELEAAMAPIAPTPRPPHPPQPVAPAAPPMAHAPLPVPLVPPTDPALTVAEAPVAPPVPVPRAAPPPRPAAPTETAAIARASHPPADDLDAAAASFAPDLSFFDAAPVEVTDPPAPPVPAPTEPHPVVEDTPSPPAADVATQPSSAQAPPQATTAPPPSAAADRSAPPVPGPETPDPAATSGPSPLAEPENAVSAEVEPEPELAPEPEPAPALPPPSAHIAVATPVLWGDLDPEVTDRAIQARLPRWTACYQAALDEDPSIRGTLELQFHVTHGHVTDLAIGTDDLGDDLLTSCLTQVTRLLRFDRGQGEAMVPLILTPGP